MVGSILRRIFDAVRFRYEREKSIQMLSSLDDRTLRDIGVERFDIRNVVESQLSIQQQHRASEGKHRVGRLEAECGI